MAAMSGSLGFLSNVMWWCTFEKFEGWHEVSWHLTYSAS